jgi:hypothetical protein
MESFERGLAETLVRWAPYVGPLREDRFQWFGLHPGQIHQRIRDIAANFLLRRHLESDGRMLLVRAVRSVPCDTTNYRKAV